MKALRSFGLFCMVSGALLLALPTPACLARQTADTGQAEAQRSSTPAPKAELDRLYKQGYEALNRGDLSDADQAWQSGQVQAKRSGSLRDEATFAFGLGYLYV